MIPNRIANPRSTMPAFCAPAALSRSLASKKTRCPRRTPPHLRRGTTIRAAVPPPGSTPDDASRLLRGYIQRLQNREDLAGEAGFAAGLLVDGVKAGTVSDAEAGAFLALQPPTAASSAALSSLAAELRARMIPADIPGTLLDIVGTGGDGFNTVNISTAAAIVAAGAGCRVAKFGNRSASSQSGSADVVEALGVSLDTDPAACIEQAGLAFLFARQHHPALGALAGPRRALGLRTVFNLLGPLVHPVPARRVVLGVYAPELVPRIAGALAALGIEHALVVHCAGLDELCPAGDAVVAEVRDGKVIGGVETLDTRIAGITRCTVKDLVGGDAEHNAGRIRGVFAGEKGPVADAIALNAGAGCFVYGLEETLEAGVRRAQRAIANGDAARALERWVAASKPR